jgi:AF1548-like, C-terminal/Restriction endonuclease
VPGGISRKTENSVKFLLMAVDIVKASGLPQKFDMRKLADSLMRSGAPEEVALDIARKVEKKIPQEASTKAVFRMAKRLLRRYNRVSGMRYSLKNALYALGPAGYRFEKYMARILRAHGYSTEVDQIMDGYCVKHEVDVLAIRKGEHFVIECKYHSDGGTATDVKTALYVHSRFVDIRKACDLKPGHPAGVHYGMLVTNTRCTTDAIKYAECVGLRVMSWKYPEKESLERIIEDRRLYPATILHSARKRTLEALFSHDIILAQDVAGMDERVLARRSGLDHETARVLKREAEELCPCE